MASVGAVVRARISADGDVVDGWSPADASCVALWCADYEEGGLELTRLWVRPVQWFAARLAAADAAVAAAGIATPATDVGGSGGSGSGTVMATDAAASWRANMVAQALAAAMMVAASAGMRKAAAPSGVGVGVGCDAGGGSGMAPASEVAAAASASASASVSTSGNTDASSLVLREVRLWAVTGEAAAATGPAAWQPYAWPEPDSPEAAALTASLHAAVPALLASGTAGGGPPWRVEARDGGLPMMRRNPRWSGGRDGGGGGGAGTEDGSDSGGGGTGSDGGSVAVVWLGVERGSWN